LRSWCASASSIECDCRTDRAADSHPPPLSVMPSGWFRAHAHGRRSPPDQNIARPCAALFFFLILVARRRIRGNALHGWRDLRHQRGTRYAHATARGRQSSGQCSDRQSGGDIPRSRTFPVGTWRSAAATSAGYLPASLSAATLPSNLQAGLPAATLPAARPSETQRELAMKGPGKSFGGVCESAGHRPLEEHR
jgi:hypothetical protein